METRLGAAMLASFIPCLCQAQTPPLAWVSQIGTSANDQGYSVTVDASGNTYVSGSTDGNLGGLHAGASDAFIAKYDAGGAQLWIRQFGTVAVDRGYYATVDSSGNAYVTGETYGSLGGANAGSNDAFLAKYNEAGNVLWTRQFGTSTFDDGRGVAVDSSGHAYVAGYTYGSLGGPSQGLADAFLIKYDDSGNQVWARQFGTSSWDFVLAVAVDGSEGVCVAGNTQGALFAPNAGDRDGFLVKYDASGNLIWARQIGTSQTDVASTVAVGGSGNVFVGGYSDGGIAGPNNGDRDAFLARYDALGNQVWARQFGTWSDDEIRDVAVDSYDNAYVTGYTGGSFGGLNMGGRDAFLAKYDALGNQVWARQLGTSNWDWSNAAAVDASGSVYIGGYTYGNLGGPNAGDADVFLAKFSPVCYADCDESGSLDLFDFLCFLNKFNAGDPYADCDGSGSLDIFDFLCFLNAFNAGCP